MKFSIACIQINPVIGQLEANIAKVRHLVLKVRNHKPDLVVLPELAITGYNFSSPQHIRPYLEKRGEGPLAQLAREISRDWGCFTVIGYPETENGATYNSCLLTSPTGDVLYNYRKTHLYEADEVWGCSENPDKSFRAIKVIVNKDFYQTPPTAGTQVNALTVNFGICMDLNPYQFTAPFNRFEMALRCYQQHARLVICPMAWLSPLADPKSDIDPAAFDKFFGQRVDVNVARDASPYAESASFVPLVPSMSTVNYWILRFLPFLQFDHGLPPTGFPTTVVTCNRVGREDKVVYGGSSSIFTFSGTGPKHAAHDATNPLVVLHGSLGMGNEGVLLRDVEVDPELVTVD